MTKVSAFPARSFTRDQVAYLEAMASKIQGKGWVASELTRPNQFRAWFDYPPPGVAMGPQGSEHMSLTVERGVYRVGVRGGELETTDFWEAIEALEGLTPMPKRDRRLAGILLQVTVSALVAALVAAALG